MDANHKKLHLDTEFFTKATVHREKIDNAELCEFTNYNLRRLGELLKPHEAYQLQGSFATHIYKAPTIEHLIFTHQNALSGVEEYIVSKALDDLKSNLMDHFSRPRQTKRSGF